MKHIRQAYLIFRWRLALRRVTAGHFTSSSEWGWFE